ncbi:uncharacterized protein LOC101766416 [Setaria italica]|uniref:uncharacterized protein LOC101766416 n=1 Tax=Setaria italica TaxID=4555 RepID=UPI0003513DA6|nr:uncharacterized protein LOC101766416 [Setaria italica]
MAAYCNEVRKLEDKFDGLELNHVTRRFNEAADELAKAASGRKPVLDGVFIGDQYKPSIHYTKQGGIGNTPSAPDSGADPGEVGNTPSTPDSGADPGEFGNSPPALDSKADPSDPEVMEIDANPTEGPDPPPGWRALYLNYLIRELLPTDKIEELYKRSHTGILQCCIPIKQGKALIQNIHAGAYSHHATPRTLVGNAF